jgi:hypothetical protein
MLRRMDSHELTEWMAYFEIRHEGPEAPQAQTEETPEELSRRLKAALFKKAN